MSKGNLFGRVPTALLVTGILLGASLFFAGCSQNGSDSITSVSGQSQGSLAVRITGGSQSGNPEMPGTDGRCPLPDTGITQLFLAFDAVRVYPVAVHDDDEDEQGEDEQGEDDDHEGTWPDSLQHPCDPEAEEFIEILTNPITVDAADLADSLGILLASSSLPAGKYSHLAIRITGASAVTDSGETVTVTPLSPRGMLHVISQFTVVEGEAVTIQIYIDLDRSVREVPPGSGNFVLMPVLFGEVRGHGDEGHGGHGPGDYGHGGHGHGGSHDD